MWEHSEACNIHDGTPCTCKEPYWKVEQDESWIAESIGFKAGDRVLINGSTPATFVRYTEDGFCRVTCADPWSDRYREIPSNPDWLTLA